MGYKGGIDKAQEAGREWTQIYTILIVALISMVGGALFAWPSPSVPILLQNKPPYEMTMTELSYLSIIPPIATVLGSPFVGGIIDRYGRKMAILSTATPYIICLILSAVGGPIYVYYLARIADGIGDACLFGTLPCYVSEIATPKVRGRWGNAIALSMYFGQFVINCTGSFFSISTTAYILMLLPTVFLFNYSLLPESPYWLLMKERVDDARKSLQWLRGKENVEEELTQLIADVKRQQSETGRYIDLWLIPNNKKSVFIVSAIRWIQNFCGAAAIAVYIQTIFSRSGNDLDAGTSSMIYNMTCFSCSLMASFILDKLGRRLATILSCVMCSLALFAQGGIFFVNDELKLNLPGFNVLPLIFMIMYIMSFGIGLAIVPTLLLGELFSSSIKSKACVISNISMGLSVAVTAQMFALLLETVGMYAIFWFYACCTLASTVICYYIVPETTGKTLEEIQQAFRK